MANQTSTNQGQAVKVDRTSKANITISSTKAFASLVLIGTSVPKVHYDDNQQKASPINPTNQGQNRYRTRKQTGKERIQG
jgi:hypothetical protein